jgi:hypothetical protein
LDLLHHGSEKAGVKTSGGGGGEGFSFPNHVRPNLQKKRNHPEVYRF